MEFLTALINGLSSGATYAIIAIGYTMVYGIAKMLNFAHGDIIMVGGFALYTTWAITGGMSSEFFANNPVLAPLVALVVALVFCVVLGLVVERFAYRPLRGAPSLAVLITAIGVSSLLQSLAQVIFKSGIKMLMWLPISGKLRLGEFEIAYSTLVTLGVTALIMVGLTLFVKLSKTGRAMIAVSEDRAAAQLMGVNVNAIIAITFAIGSALAAVAAYLMLMKSPGLSNTLGAMPGIKAFTAAVIGGIGSIPGAMLGGILLGVIEALSLSIPALAPFTDAVEFAILIVVLLVKPAGLLGKARREKV